MKQKLINRYFELKEKAHKYKAIAPALYYDMDRIGAILWERYGYDISLTQKFN